MWVLFFSYFDSIISSFCVKIEKLTPTIQKKDNSRCSIVSFKTMIRLHSWKLILAEKYITIISSFRKVANSLQVSSWYFIIPSNLAKRKKKTFKHYWWNFFYHIKLIQILHRLSWTHFCCLFSWLDFDKKDKFSWQRIKQ